MSGIIHIRPVSVSLDRQNRQLYIYLLTYMGVFDLGQTRVACSDGFSGPCIFVSPLILLLNGDIFTSSFFLYMSLP